MNASRPCLVLAFVLLPLLSSGPARATDVDGADCGHVIHDFGDAPEGTVRIGLTQRFAAFPTCVIPGPVGTVESIVPPRGSAPGPAGFVHHVQSGDNTYWLGCSGDAITGFKGIDSEVDGKFSSGGPVSDCAPFLNVDQFDWGVGQDEGGFGTDAGANTTLIACQAFEGVHYRTFNCGGARTVYLNVLIDLNDDGDWNDNLTCRIPGNIYCSGACTSPDGAAHEWAIQNLAVTIPSGCSFQSSPPFETGALSDRMVWTRISLTDAPVSADFPWAGSANEPGGTVAGGESEDYLVLITTPLAVHPSSWGALKLRYR